MTADVPKDLPQECVQDYPRPPRLERVPHRLRVELLDACVAETTAGFRVLETHHPPTYYFPPEDIHAVLEPLSGRTFCEWKGVASFFDVRMGEAVVSRAAWCYSVPNGAFAALKDHVAFYPELMTVCAVGGVTVTPQPGSFYGGWVTPNLTGQIKGAPGTAHW